MTSSLKFESILDYIKGNISSDTRRNNSHRIAVDYDHTFGDGEITTRAFIGPIYTSKVNADAAASIIRNFTIIELQSALKDENTYCSFITRFRVYVIRD